MSRKTVLGILYEAFMLTVVSKITTMSTEAGDEMIRKTKGSLCPRGCHDVTEG